jgi:hypothetical protein
VEVENVTVEHGIVAGLHVVVLNAGAPNPGVTTAVSVRLTLPRTGPPFSAVAVIVTLFPVLEPRREVVDVALAVSANQPHVVEHAELLNVVPV